MRRRRGVALIEVVLALAIFSVAVVGLTRSLNSAIDADRMQALNEDIRIRLQNDLAQAMAEKVEPGEKTFSADDLPGVQFRRVIREISFTTPAGQDLDRLYEIRVVAAYMRGDRELTSTVEVYVYRP